MDISRRSLCSCNHSSGGSVLVWATVSYNHKTDLHIVQGNTTALKYRDTVLIPTVYPLVAHTGLTFQDDNARPHRARIVTDYVQQQGLQTLPWSARSPNLSPIEQLWDELEMRPYERHPGIRTRQQQEQVLRQEWQAIPQRTVRNVINSMRSRVNACIDRNGGLTRY